MRTILLAAILAFVAPAWAQAPTQPAETEKKVEKVKRAKKATARRQMDARHCLQQPTNDAIIRCAEEYL
jgi:hypothetical protein